MHLTALEGKVEDELASIGSPWDVEYRWNAALYDGNRSLALRLTSVTAFATPWWQSAGGVEGLIRGYSTFGTNRPTCTLLEQEIQETRAEIQYACEYADGSKKRWFSVLLWEDGGWKVAPQFVKVEPAH